MKMDTVGVIGGYGEVGSGVVSTLREVGVRLRIGGRNIDRCERFVRERLLGEAESMCVDVHDVDQLERFASGCSVLVNCSGASLDEVLRVARYLNLHYADAYGPNLRDRDELWQGSERCAVVGAGFMPGLSGLLPQMATQGLARVTELTVHVGGLDRVSATALSDLLQSSRGDGPGPSTLWHQGRVQRGVQVRQAITLPYFPRPVTAFPALSSEAVRVITGLSVPDSAWWTVFDGVHGPRSLRRLALNASHAGSVDEQDIAEVRAANALDCFGRSLYQVVWILAQGTLPRGDRASHEVVLRTRNSSVLSGLVLGEVVRQIISGSVRPGLAGCDEVISAAKVVEALADSPFVDQLTWSNAPGALEEGTV